MSADTALLGLIVKLAEQNPRVATGVLMRLDPRLADLAHEVEKLAKEWVEEKRMATPLVCLGLILGAGYIIGAGVDTTQPDAGLVTEKMTDLFVNLLRFSAEEGFAEAAKLKGAPNAPA